MCHLPEGLSRARALRDVLLALALIVFAFATGGTFAVVLGAVNRDRPDDLLSVVLLLAQCLPLIVRRTRPDLALGVIGLAWGVYQLMGYEGSSAGLALYIVLYSAGAHLTRRRWQTAAGATFGYLVLAVTLHRTPYHETPLSYVTFAPVLVLFWMIGEGVRARTRAEAARRAAQKREAVAQERAHIARELHDVVTHHVTAMVVQAEALPYLLPGNPDKVRDGLGTISATGRSAMTDLRELLDVLHDPGTSTDQERTPARESLEVLVERARAAGQDVTFAEHGDPAPIPTGLGLALQRVVQESLTNALKHAPGRTTAVTLTHGEDELDVAVVTSGGATTPRRPWARSGRGINGMRDRVAAFGGELTVGQEPGGGFAVRAKLPRRPAA
ncbi:histidine kinase [Kineosporia sp. NBRC 101731]|uniref:sensor histidine kinase n=1 Tax=Kineosporia sp. NBRC 101731 TaxID=3032199 RepID=UPI002554063E|nr:histidine kinase [Kineosporia sp. NBRC 101731]